MALEGSFKDFHIADIVQLIGLQRKTGTLTLEGEEDTLSMYFHEGALVGGQSTRNPWEHRLARLLVPRGVLTPEQLEGVLTLQREARKNLQVILAERRHLNKEAWGSMLAIEIREALYRPFRWTTGRYRFVTQSSVDPGEGRVSPIGSEDLLMEAVRRVDEWPAIQQRVPSMALVHKLNPQGGRGLPKQADSNEAAMLTLVDGKRSVQELVDASGLGEFEALRGLAKLVGAGAIVSVGPPAAPARAEAPTEAGAGVPAAPAVWLQDWLPRVAWGLVVLWLVGSVIVFRSDPSGLIPLSDGRIAALNQVRILRTQAELTELSRYLEGYLADTGAVPAGLEVLRAPAGLRKDPWGHAYQLRSPADGDRSEDGPGSAFRVTVVSAGPDGRMGTEDDLTPGRP